VGLAGVKEPHHGLKGPNGSKRPYVGVKEESNRERARYREEVVPRVTTKKGRQKVGEKYKNHVLPTPSGEGFIQTCGGTYMV